MKKNEPKEKKEQEWSDEIPDDENDEAYEKNYRDGSTQHECWDPDA